MVHPGITQPSGFGLVPSHEVVSGVGYAYIEILNGVFWAVVYGFLGAVIDWARLARARKVA
jgi:hypothetical protein